MTWTNAGRGRSRRTLIGAGVIATVLAACGSSATTAEPTATTTSAPGAATTAALATTAAGAPTTSAPDPGDVIGPDGCVTDFDPDADYFPDKVTPTHSTMWSAAYHRSYVVLTTPDSENPGRPDLDYVLVRCGAPTPELDPELADALTITVPVARTATNHNNAIAMLDQLGELSSIVGLAQSQLKLAGDAYGDKILAAANDPVAIAPSGDELDYEATLGVEPDIVFMAGYGPSYQNVTAARERSIPAVMISNRIEPEPLGSAEWMKFVSVFYGKEALANSRFGEIEAAYDAAAAAVAGQMPSGFSAAYLCIEPDNGCEFVYAHGPKSFNGKILDTLGVTNPFAEGNDAGNGQTFDYEDALGRAADVDLIIDYELPDAVSATLAADQRFDAFKAFAEGSYLTYVPENYGFCRFNLYVLVDIPITDYAIGMAPDLFPGQTGRCFAAPPT